ncbi:MAG: class I SAM-dependent methyltransferase [Bacteroidetes bacterium]|nr:class I SAM-dependent methyltransferase [Bacteroidota bacterium]
MNPEFAGFTGTIPDNYDLYMGPLFFEPYAIDLTERIKQHSPKKVLEIACGTGRVTNHLRRVLPADAELIATDLNAGMLAVAKHKLASANIVFKEVDAQALPFADNSFDLIICQFGFMFMPDKPKAFAEAHRVLLPGGKLLFNTWDKLENNKASFIVRNVVAEALGKAEFYNIPFSMNDKWQIESTLRKTGFDEISVSYVSKKGTGITALEAAKGLLLGTPAFKQILEAGNVKPEELVIIAQSRLEDIYGKGPITTELNAWVVEAKKE